MNPYQKLQEAAAYLHTKTLHRPKIAVILGSGLGDFANNLTESDIIPYATVPHFPHSTVEGHKGQFVITKDLMCMQGRVHFYEGYSMNEVVFPIRVMKLLGIETLIVTNASGGINLALQGGDLMLISDHINLMGANPLFGKNFDDFGERFPDLSFAYTPELRKLAHQEAAALGIHLHEGVYIGMSGPNYETPAEIRMARILGADAVGMSTVPEVIVAAHAGMQVLGISSITNMAAGVLDTPLSHKEVIAATEQGKDSFAALLQAILHKLLAK